MPSQEARAAHDKIEGFCAVFKFHAFDVEEGVLPMVKYVTGSDTGLREDVWRLLQGWEPCCSFRVQLLVVTASRRSFKQ